MDPIGDPESPRLPLSNTYFIVAGRHKCELQARAEAGALPAQQDVEHAHVCRTARGIYVTSRGAEHTGGRLVNERQPASPKSCSGDLALANAVGCSKMLECSLFARRKRWMSRESPEGFGSVKTVADVLPEPPKTIPSVSARFGDMS